jgi:hypothetical protein
MLITGKAVVPDEPDAGRQEGEADDQDAWRCPYCGHARRVAVATAERPTREALLTGPSAAWFIRSSRSTRGP